MLPPYIFACLILAAILHVVGGYSDGNTLPISCCIDMKPRPAVGVGGLEGHLRLPQNQLPGEKPPTPYYIQIHQEEKDYKLGASITVSVIANQTKQLMYYKGILLQARTVICASNNTVQVEDTPQGAFTVPRDSRQTLLATMDCTGTNSRSAVRHKSNAMKINETFTWTAPSENVGNIVFRAVIIHQGDNYWSDIHSPVLREPGKADVVPPRCGTPELKVNKLLPIMMIALSVTLRKILLSH